MKQLFLFIATAITSTSFAQRIIDVTAGGGINNGLFYTVGGEPVVTAKFVRTVSGSPFFKDEWMSSLVVLPSGAQFKNVKTKLNLVENAVHYLDAKGDEMIATSPVKEIVFTDPEGQKFMFINAAYLGAAGVTTGWVQLLFSGTASLYKYFIKETFFNKPYGSATEERTIKTKEKYLVVYNNAAFEIRKMKDAPAVLANKKTELEQFLASKKKSGNSLDEDFIDFIRYYNSLLQ